MDKPTSSLGLGEGFLVCFFPCVKLLKGLGESSGYTVLQSPVSGLGEASVSGLGPHALLVASSNPSPGS